jgi:hypothetical protein
VPKSLLIGILLACFAEALAWTQVQAQFLDDKFKNNFLFVLILAPLVALMYWRANYHLVNHFGEFWPSRLIFFGTGTFVFAILTLTILGEPINAKTGVSLLLALGIILIQIFL